MAASSKPWHQRRSWLVGCCLLAFLAALGIGLLLWQAVALSSLATVAQRVSEAKPLLGAVRLGLIALLALLWPWLSDWLCKKRHSSFSIAESNQLRWRVVGWLLVIELLIGQSLLTHLAVVTGVSP
jgi:hypothetical protein